MRLRLTTWNLQGNHQRLDTEAVARHLEQTGSDVVLLQEVQVWQARVLADRLKAKSFNWSFKHRPLVGWSEGLAIVGVTESLTDVRARACTRRWWPFSWRRRIVQFARLGEVAIANAHLSPHESGQQARQREISWLLARLPRGDCVLAGDLNAEPDATELEHLGAAGWTEAGTAPTNWRGRRDRPPKQRIDYVWASPNLEIVKATIPPHEDFARLSDHLPLTADITTRVQAT